MPVNFDDSSSNGSRDIKATKPSDAAISTVFGTLITFKRKEIVMSYLSGVVVEPTGVKVHVKFVE